MKPVKAVCLILALVWAFSGSFSAHGQTLERGAIMGTVYDTSHGVVPNAKVTLINPSTGYRRELITEATGDYAFDNVAPGEYTLTTEAANFATTRVKQIEVNVGSAVKVDVTMQLKTQSQTVEVTATAAEVEVPTAGISQLLNQTSVRNLPFPGRDYRDLAQLTPSAQVVPGLRGGIRLGGQQSENNGLVIDGADTTNNFFGENFGSLETKNLTVPLEAVQEFQVVTNGFAPEFGRATGGLLNVVTKSGTNQLHGEAHEYYRGSSLTKDDALHNPPNIDNQSQFGGSIGFPIHKDRQFLFVSTDIQRNTGPLTTNLCHGAPACTADAGPVIPVVAAGSVDRLGPACAGATPGVTHLLPGCYGVPNLGALEGPHPQFQDFFTILGHYDYQFSSANHFSIRGLGTRNHTRGFTGGHGQAETFDSFGDTEDFVNQGISGLFSLTTVLGRKVNEIRAMVEGETRKRHPIFKGAPEISIAGVGEFGQRFYLPGNNDNGKLQVQDNFSYSFGKHDVKFGGDVDTFVDRKDIFAGWSAGRYNFASLADFDKSNPNFYFQGFGLNGIDPFTANTLFPAYQTGLGLYWQDKWQVSSHLILTYGLRWDGTWNPQPQTPIPGKLVYVGVGAGSHVAPVPQRSPNDFSQWGPRLGIAWNVGGASHPTVVRAAWGLYYAQTPTIFFPATSNGGGSKSTTLFCNPSFGCAPPSGAPYNFPSTISTTSQGLCNPPPSPPVPAIGCPSIVYADPAFRNPRASNLTVGVEHQIGGGWTVSANYVFMHSSHLKTGGFSTSVWSRNLKSLGTDKFGRAILAAEATNTTCPATGATLFAGTPVPLDCTLGQFTGANELGSFSRGNYHEVVIGADKRFAHHYQLFASYTWSRNYSNDSSERDTDTFFGTQDPFNINIDYGRNGLDITHQFKSGVVVDLPWGLNWSSNFIYHSGLAYPAYASTINVVTTDDSDINGDTVANQFSNNDRPVLDVGGKQSLLTRYPARQPDFFTWDMRLSKDFRFSERYQLRLSADIFNVTNRGNLYSNPDNTGFVTLSKCQPNATGVAGFTCAPLTAIPRQGNVFRGIPYGVLDEISPGSTAFAAQFGVRFQF